MNKKIIFHFLFPVFLFLLLNPPPTAAAIHGTHAMAVAMDVSQRRWRRGADGRSGEERRGAADGSLLAMAAHRRSSPLGHGVARRQVNLGAMQERRGGMVRRS